MNKHFAILLSYLVLISSLLIAQEEPKKNDETSQNNTQVKTEQSSDSKVDSNEIVIWNKVCPVKGNPIEEDTPTVEYDGKVYGFCCPGCDTKFANNPEKYAKNLSEDGTRFIGRK